MCVEYMASLSSGVLLKRCSIIDFGCETWWSRGQGAVNSATSCSLIVGINCDARDQGGGINALCQMKINSKEKSLR